MIQEVKNPLAIRSQEWLANALLSLMEEKDFRDISIKEIAERRICPDERFTVCLRRRKTRSFGI